MIHGWVCFLSELKCTHHCISSACYCHTMDSSYEPALQQTLLTLKHTSTKVKVKFSICLINQVTYYEYLREMEVQISTIWRCEVSFTLRKELQHHRLGGAHSWSEYGGIEMSAPQWEVNHLKPELNPICYLLALLGAHHFLHVSRIRVKLLTFGLLMSYIYIYVYIYIWSTHSWCF